MNKQILISYSQRDEHWRDLIIKYLEKHGIDYPRVMLLDDGSSSDNHQSTSLLKSVSHQETVIILLVSAAYLSSDLILDVHIPVILPHSNNKNIYILPLIVTPCPWEKISWLNRLTVYPKSGEPLSSLSKYNMDFELADLAEQIAGLLLTHQANPPLQPFQPESPVPTRIEINRLPVPGKHFIGREKELEMLNQSWFNADKNKTRIVTLIAWGGTGKSALVHKWVQELIDMPSHGATHIYGWSFYSQGAGEGKQISADLFFSETLAYFGDSEPHSGSAVDRGRRLARLIADQSVLLILDGLEPLQYPANDGSGLGGKLKDPGMAAMLKQLALQNNGLCIITSREPLADLEGFTGKGVTEAKLERLSDHAGADLLEAMGVIGRRADLLKAVHEYGGHALALNLLGQYVLLALEGDIRRRDTIPRLMEEPRQGGHARQVMAAYDRRFGGKPEADILRLMGLFDRPAEKDALEVLRREPAIPGVTSRITGLTEHQWNAAVTHLVQLSLLAKESVAGSRRLDCHPLVREHFAAVLEAEAPEGKKEAHLRLYGWYKEKPTKELPDTIDEMLPLFAAVAHGCMAGIHQAARDEVHYKRILREDKYYSLRQLGAFGADLSALWYFFQQPWSQPAEGLREGTKAAVLSWAAFRLRALGRLREAGPPME
ncbi:MAG: hypothetical protein GY940_43895, partial [bacterium]|nr:hypothetical protein [bacterium]